jgi:hypothetical protein
MGIKFNRKRPRSVTRGRRGVVPRRKMRICPVVEAYGKDRVLHSLEDGLVPGGQVTEIFEVLLGFSV